MMKRRKSKYPFILVIILLWNLPALSQITYQQAETLTYRYLMEKKWDSVILTGNLALKKKIDYSFLRLRIGIAEYEQKKYISSAWHLERALGFNNNDKVATSYLYSAYQLSNRNDEARALTAGMTPEEKNELGQTTNILDNIYVEMGGGLSNAFAKSDPLALMGSDSIYGEQDLYGNNYYGNLAFSLNVSPRVKITAGYSYLSFQKRVMYQYAYPVDIIDSTVIRNNRHINYYSFPRVSGNNTFNYPLYQNEFFVGVTIIPAPGVSIMPAFRYVSVKYTYASSVHNTWTVQDTSMYNTATGNYFTFPFTRTSYGFSEVSVNLNNYLVGLKITKQAGIFNAGMAISWSDFNSLEQLQGTWNLAYFPLGNLAFYGNTSLIALVEEGDGRLVFTQMLGAKVFRWLWVEGDFLYGNIAGGNLDNGLIVYNIPDKVDYRAGLSLIIPVLSNMQLTLMYRFFQKESMITYYSPEPNYPVLQVMPQTRGMRYQTNNIFLGLKINI